MTKRTFVSTDKNIWFDTQAVDDSDLTLEQEYNESITGAIINNHIGTGVIPEVLEQNIIFDSSLENNYLDGLAISAQNQPTDSNFGNQLSVILTNSLARGRKKVKVGIIGLDFNGNLQYETFAFSKNEIQIGKKHFVKVLVLLFNDFIGDPNLSLNLGGNLLIKESKAMELSRDCKVLSQDIEPNLFFRDFFIDGPLTITGLLENALPTYNIDTLNIYTNEKDLKRLVNGDVVTQFGQKFLAETNNIQKITVLMSVENTGVNPNDLVWNGDLILTVYKLQTDVINPLDIVPNLAIEFQPDPVPIAQLSVDYTSLRNNGITLNNVLQPIDFIFSNSPIAGGNVIEVGQYYAFTLKRSGAANKCDLLIAVGNDNITNSRVTVFTGTVWVDIPEEDLWFQLWSDSAKVSDGQAYDTGHGIMIDKTIVDEETQATIDFSYDDINFVGNDIYKAMLSAVVEKSTPVPSEITGNPVLSRQKMVPKVDLLNTIDLSNINLASEPLLLGAISDKNIKFYDSISSEIHANLRSGSIIDDQILIRVVSDSTDTVRYDTSVNEMITSLLNGDFVGAKITPNGGNPFVYYKIASAELCSMIVGDVNGDGIVDSDDIDILYKYKGYNLNVSPPNISSINTTGNLIDGYYTTYTNGYQTLTLPFANEFSLQFQLVRKSDGYVIIEEMDGTLIADPNDSSQAQFTSSSLEFNTIVGLSDYKLVIINSSVNNNLGAFDIVSLQSATDVLTIQKQYLTPEVFEQMFRADIDGDFIISDDDGYLLTEYVKNNPDSLSSTSTYPRPSTIPYTKIGTSFNVIRLKLETYNDRNDDYVTNLSSGRSSLIHLAPDIYSADGYFQNHNFYTNPSTLVFEKKLTWDESLVVTNSLPKLLPSVFTTSSGHIVNSCTIDGINVTTYPQQPEFDKGRVDFFIPDNLIIGPGGSFKNIDGSEFKVDFEVASIVLEVPDGLFGTERTINILQDFIAEYGDKGVTRLGYPAMKFADCSYVQLDALENDQIRFSVAMQSFSPQVDGLTEDGYEGAIVDGKMGIYVDHENGTITLNFSNLYEDSILPTLSTKIQITVYIKKASFNNKTKFIDSDRVHNMLSLISVFSGANVGGVSALVDVEDDVTGILPILHGGTGLNAVGVAGTVLTSNGSGLSYSFISDLPGVVAYSSGISDAGKMVKLDGYGKLSNSFYYNQPVAIYALAGIESNDTEAPMVIGAFNFRFDEYALGQLDSIRLEVILENNLPDGASPNNAKISLFSVSEQLYLNLNGSDGYLSTSSETPVVLQSDDLKNLLLTGAANHVYEVHLYLTNSTAIYDDPTLTDQAVCKGAKLVLKYDNPIASPPLANEYNFHPNPVF